MTEQTVEVGDTRVTIRETDDGFEAVPSEPNPGTVEAFVEDTGFSAGDSLSTGRVDYITERYDGGVKFTVENADHDVVRNAIENAVENNWIPVKVEFEYGYILFRDQDA